MALSDVQIRFPTAPSRARVRALKVCDKHAQANGQDFVEHIIEKFPSRIKEIRTGNGHEFQAKFRWHVEDHGIRHAYIKRETPQLNRKVERSRRSDQQEWMKKLHAALAHLAEGMLTHQQWIDKFCKAGPVWGRIVTAELAFPSQSHR